MYIKASTFEKCESVIGGAVSGMITGMDVDECTFRECSGYFMGGGIYIGSEPDKSSGIVAQAWSLAATSD
jgi:hypothetical protein